MNRLPCLSPYEYAEAHLLMLMDDNAIEQNIMRLKVIFEATHKSSVMAAMETDFFNLPY